MKIHRFIGDFDLSKKELEIAGEEANQMIRVLKLKVGEKIELADGKGISAMAEITEINGRKLKVNIEPARNAFSIADAGGKQVSLFCSVLKKENFELVVQKATECGVSKIIPIITSRTVKTGLNIERLRKIAKEASEQSGRNIIPEISEPISFDEALDMAKPARNAFSIADADGENLNILFDASGELLFERLCGALGASTNNFSPEKYMLFPNNNSPRGIWIGPEGGWIEDELKKAQAHNFKIASLGSLTLRGETAAIIATYLVSNFA